MYKRFFDLQERPFDLSPNPSYLVLTDPHREAISNIEYAIAAKKGITLLIGVAGSGKTTVIRAAIAGQPTVVHCVHLHNLALTRPEFIEMMGASFGLSEGARESKTALLLELESLLRRRHEAGESTVLVVDEAQTLSLSLLEEIRLLANIETNQEKLLSVVLAGQPELATRLDEPSMSQLKQRVALWCELRPLTFDETAGYILSRIRSAGGVASEVFTLQAVKLIHETARGIPRIINVIADNALIGGYAGGQRPVTAQIVGEVCRDFRMHDGHEIIAPPLTPAESSSPSEAPSLNGGDPSDREAFPIFVGRSEPSLLAKVWRRYLS